MSDQYTVVSNINYQSESFQRRLVAEIVDKLAFTSSGILQRTNFFNNDDGDFVNITQYPTVTGSAQQIQSGVRLEYRSFSDYKQRAAWLLRGDGWGQENLVQIITGADPETEILRQLANYVARNIQDTAISVIKGIMATALASSHSTGVNFSGNTISYAGIGEAKQKLGDSQLLLTKSISNSKVISDAVQLNIASFNNSSLGNQTAQTGALPTIMGMDTWMDDAIAAVAGVYSTYFSSPSSLVYQFSPWVRRDINGNVVASSMIDIEPWRDPAMSGGLDIFYVRFKYLVHPLGMQYNSATKNPTDAQLATGSNWTKVADDNRKIKIVELKTK